MFSVAFISSQSLSSPFVCSLSLIILKCDLSRMNTLPLANRAVTAFPHIFTTACSWDQTKRVCPSVLHENPVSNGDCRFPHVSAPAVVSFRFYLIRHIACSDVSIAFFSISGKIPNHIFLPNINSYGLFPIAGCGVAR